MDVAIPIGYYEDLIIQIETDYNNLKKAFGKFKENTSDRELLFEFCQIYAYLLQDINYIEKFK